MLRPSPTIISLSKKDMREHLENISHKDTTAQCNRVAQPVNARFLLQQDFSCQKISISDFQVTPWNPNGTHHTRQCIDGETIGDHSEGLDDPLEYGLSNDTFANEIPQMTASNGMLSSPNLLPVSRLLPYEEDEDGYLAIGISHPNNNAGEDLEPIQWSSLRDSGSRWQFAPQESAFDYGGTLQRSSRDSSSFVPDDVSTPQNTKLPTLQRLRARNPLPRSPLFRSYNPRSSPERIRSVGLAPHLLSPGIPGVLFSQPARRSRDYRHRTSVFSLEATRTTNANSEGSEISSVDSQVGLSLFSGRGRFYDASLQSPDGESSHSPSPKEHIFHAGGATRSRGGMVSEYVRSSDLSSHSLHLPPPFSTSSRTGSANEPLPVELSSSTGLSPKAFPRGDAGSCCRVSPGPVTLDNISGGQRTQQSPSSASTTRSVLSVPSRLISAYRSRSPIGPWHLSSRTSPTPERGRRDTRIASSANPPSSANTPHRRLRVYDDGVPAFLQPQTPQQLPEARHQSHYHSAYTAPTARRHGSAQQLRDRIHRRRGRSNDSPTGLDIPGFAGLYGGQENTEDEIMFERAAQRLFLRRESGRDVNRSGADTSERETSFYEA